MSQLNFDQFQRILPWQRVHAEKLSRKTRNQPILSTLAAISRQVLFTSLQRNEWACEYLANENINTWKHMKYLWFKWLPAYVQETGPWLSLLLECSSAAKLSNCKGGKCWSSKLPTESNLLTSKAYWVWVPGFHWCCHSLLPSVGKVGLFISTDAVSSLVLYISYEWCGCTYPCPVEDRQAWMNSLFWDSVCQPCLLTAVYCQH